MLKVSAKMDYALRALVELGLHWPNTVPRQINDIGPKTGVSQKFLVHILIVLKGLGYVNSARGRMGGYTLAVDPGKINLADLLIQLGALGSLRQDTPGSRKDDAVSIFWSQIDQRMATMLRETTLADICERQRQQGKVITYEI